MKNLINDFIDHKNYPKPHTDSLIYELLNEFVEFSSNKKQTVSFYGEVPSEKEMNLEHEIRELEIENGNLISAMNSVRADKSDAFWFGWVGGIICTLILFFMVK